MALPTGIGKSLLGQTYAVLGGFRSVTLTATRSLQDQYQQSFPDLMDIRGMANYPCRLAEGRSRYPISCADGPCLDGEVCQWRAGGCDYYDRLSAAKLAPHICTNYPMWFTHGTDGLGSRDLVILDEAHECPEVVSSWLRVSLGMSELHSPRDPESFELEDWRDWADQECSYIESLLERATGRERRKLSRLRDQLLRLSICGGDWIAQPSRRGWQFEPLWPRQYAGPRLWGGIKRVVLLSATVRPCTLEQIGLEPDQYDWIECPSPFPVGRRPVYHIPTARLSARTWEDPGTRGIWVDHIDALIGARLDRKGIVHTVSYDRAQYLLGESEWHEFMITHGSREASEAVERFKATDPPAVLVSPSVHTGHDFAYVQGASYQIIAKVPWPNPSEPITAARTEDDPSYPATYALTRIVQAAGRVMRAPDDYGETFCTDDHIDWLMKRYGEEFTPTWFRDAYRSAVTFPAPGRIY